jgi:hypothetical protein
MRVDADGGSPRVIVQIAPPGQGGVADFVQCLDAVWIAQGLASLTLTLSKANVRELALVDRIGRLVSERHLPWSLVLHFSGYGYATRGVCFWLLEELRVLRAHHGGSLKLVVVFHETFATGPPWRSAFWVSPLQERIAVRLASMADAVWTNTDEHARWLRPRMRDSARIVVRPVLSNVGEPRTLLSSSDRDSCAVVFGLASTRQRAFDGLRGHEGLLQRLGVTELIEVGNGPASTHALHSIACRHAGRLEQPALTQLLGRARFGVVHYPSHHLGKSGVFAAYAAHGCVALNTCATSLDTDGLAAGTHYLSLPALAAVGPFTAGFDAIAARLAAWYADHTVDVQARELLTLATR